ncbi:MAG: EF-hand domain-containing protein [Rhizobium sp.]
MDTDGDGSISEAEFVAARPSDVSEDQATALFKSFDTSNSGSLTQEQLANAMQQPNGPPPPPPADDSTDSTSDDDQTSSLFSDMDTDGDGSISQAEFIAARPSDVSEEQATTLFNSLDTTGSGSLTESQLEDGLKSQQPPPLPDFGSLYSANYQDDTTSELLTA